MDIIKSEKPKIVYHLFCLACGEPIAANRKNRRTHDLKCRIQVSELRRGILKDKYELHCAICGEPFSPKTNNIGDDTCSEACGIALKKIDNPNAEVKASKNVMELANERIKQVRGEENNVEELLEKMSGRKRPKSKTLDKVLGKKEVEEEPTEGETKSEEGETHE